MTVIPRMPPSPKAREDESEILKIIEKGGSVTTDKNEESEDDEVRFTLRLPKELMDRIDKSRKQRKGFTSRNSFLCELIDKHA